MVPDDDLSRPVVAPGDHAFETAVVDGVGVGLHRQAFFPGVERRSLRDRPRPEDAIHLQTEVVMEARCPVLLYDERAARTFPGPALGFGCLVEPALLVVFLKSHAPVSWLIGACGENRLKL